MGYCKYQRRPGGVVLVVVLVCLMIASMLSVAVVRQIVAERRTLEMSHRNLQTRWFAETGLERAAARLAVDEKYSGETWTIPAKELAASDPAVIRIQVETVAEQPQRRSVRVEADYPADSQQRCRKMKQIVVDRDAILTRQPAKTSD